MSWKLLADEALPGAPACFALEPRLPRGRLFSEAAYWSLDDEGRLRLVWSGDVSGAMTIELSAVQPGVWRGTFRTEWDMGSSRSGRRPPDPVLELSRLP